MGIKLILAPSLLLYVVVVLLINDMQNPAYLFFQPPDSLEYLTYTGSLSSIFELMMTGGGNYFVTIPYMTPSFFDLSDQIQFYVPLVNGLVTLFVFRYVEFPRVSGLILMFFLMGTILGISKEFWLFIGFSSLYISGGRGLLFALTIISRPQILPVIFLWRPIISRLSYGALLVLGVIGVFAAYHSGIFFAQDIFKERAGLQQSSISDAIDFLLADKFYTFPLGIFLSLIRLLFEFINSFFSGKMFGVTLLFASTVFVWRFNLLKNNKNIKSLMKLLLFFILLLSALPFPHSRYLISILIAIIVFEQFKYKKIT